MAAQIVFAPPGAAHPRDSSAEAVKQDHRQMKDASASSHGSCRSRTQPVPLSIIQPVTAVSPIIEQRP